MRGERPKGPIPVALWGRRVDNNGRAQMIKKAHSLSAVAGVLTAGGLLVIGTSAIAVAANKGRADSSKLHLAITHSAGGFNYSSGDGTDRLLGPVVVTYKLKTLGTTTGKIKVTVPKARLWTSNGTLSGTASADLTVTDSKGDAKLTNGKFSLTKGSGGQSGHSEVGTFTGTGNINGGVYTLLTKGTYK